MFDLDKRLDKLCPTAEALAEGDETARSVAAFVMWRYREDLKQLIRDVLKEVTPESELQDYERWPTDTQIGWDSAINDLEANIRKLGL